MKKPPWLNHGGVLMLALILFELGLRPVMRHGSTLVARTFFETHDGSAVVAYRPPVGKQPVELCIASARTLLLQP